MQTLLLRRRSVVSPLLALVLALAGCGDDGPDTGDAGVEVDAFVLPPSGLFGSCVEDSQCPGEGAICRRDDDGYPSGYCTVPCDDRTPCDAFGSYHHCVQRQGETRRYCEQRCLNGIDCGRDGYTCAGEVPPSGGLCIGVCSDDAHCSEGYTCDRPTGQCLAPGAPTPSGAALGSPCGSDAACRSGSCLEAENGGTPTGYLGGTCVANCILPRGYNTSSFWNGATLPAGTCEGGAICFPTDSLTEGDLGTCFAACEGNEDCRPGYQCASSFNTSSGRPASFDNGVCLPIDCSRTPCPSGSSCVRVPRSDGSTSSVCAS